MFLGSTAVAEGLSPNQLRSPAWRRVMHGVYADPQLPVDHGISVRAASLVLSRDAAIAGWSAAWLHGARTARRAGDPVHVVVPAASTARHRRGVVVHRRDVDSGDIVERNGLRLTSPQRTAWDVAATEAVVEAVVVLDELLRTRALDLTSLTEYAHRRAGRRGSVRALATVSLADGRAESPPESRLRLSLVLAGLHPVPQLRIADDRGRFVARVDLGFPAHRVAVEYDGAYHAAPGQFGKDRERLNALTAAGWTVVFVTAADMYAIDGVVDRVRGALVRVDLSTSQRSPAHQP